MPIIRALAVTLLAFVSFAGTPLTYSSFNTPYAANATNIYIVWYGAWTDTTSQAIIADFLNQGLTVVPSVQVAKLYPVGPNKNVMLNPQFSVAAQINQPYSDTYDGGTPGAFAKGAAGEELLVGNLITMGSIPTPVVNAKAETNTYVMVFLGPGITSAGGECAYSTFSSNNYLVSVVLDQTNLATSCAGFLPLNNKVSGTVTSDEAIFGIAAEATHSMQALSWEVSGSTIEELCLDSTVTPQTSPICTGGSAVCQYTVSVTPNGSQRYYFLSNTYVNMPPGSTYAACAQSYTPPPGTFWLIGKL